LCRKWAALTDEPALWKALIQQKLPTVNVEAGGTHLHAWWKEAYFALARCATSAMVVIMGPSGSGKTTLFDFLSSLHPEGGKAGDEVQPKEKNRRRMPRQAHLLLQAPRRSVALTNLSGNKLQEKTFWSCLIGAHCAIIVIRSNLDPGPLFAAAYSMRYQ
jgi:hypothetical protein